MFSRNASKRPDEYELDDIQTAFEDSIFRKNEVVKAAIRIR